MLSKLTFAAVLAATAIAAPGLPAQAPLTRPHELALSGIPLLGFGTWNLKGDNVSEAVAWAIQVGYRHIDCAAAYYNQPEVGKGIQKGLAKSGLKREDLWITSKLWNDHHGTIEVEAALEETLKELGVGYLDLWHMHWPVSQGLLGNSIEYIDTWQSMVSTLASGRVRHLGVSNFSPKQLEKLVNSTDYPPQVHQMELHPYLQQNDWVELHTKYGIHVTAYSPLGGTNPVYKGDPPPLLGNKVVREIAHKRSCSPAQVVLKWGFSRGTSVIPKSIHKDYIVENFLASECELTSSDLDKIDELGKYHNRYNNPSLSWDVDLYEGLEDSKGKHKLHS